MYEMKGFDLHGKKAIVTGGVQGLGKAMAQALYESGCTLCIMDINPNTPELCKQLQTGDAPVYGVTCDLSNPETLHRGFQEAVGLLGGELDILLNDAGVNFRKGISECTPEAWETVFKINSTAPFLLTKYASEIMKKKGYGKIINVASMLSFLGAVGNASYAASKGSVLLQTKSFSNELAPYGICVNAIAPGYFHTELNTPERMAVLGEDFLKSINLRIPAGRWGEPEDLQGTVVFLASPASDYVTGACINVDGGYLAR